MGHLKIHCDNCGSDWIVYHRDDWKDWRARNCPMCGESIDSQTWDEQILPAFGAMEDANRELFKDHTGYHGTLFTVTYEPDIIYPNKNDGIEELRELIEELQDELEMNSFRKAILESITRKESDDESC